MLAQAAAPAVMLAVGRLPAVLAAEVSVESFASWKRCRFPQCCQMVAYVSSRLSWWACLWVLRAALAPLLPKSYRG